ncbi:BZ3500_MvSof-1268-A1-R1_Chr3-3g06426 [Microbotryum saponariae]|uniref:Palmitoyltransferase n=1 Tax=Microbotryum saponariae TaxID=289078 RepID=A0A2X0LNS2_9BASI|nr:BZ3500_MvSof-1268-A1-R1_Chr3-3g06426 [Microbotryum saponariae]SDA04393.1 BZ3501_MvSof-1269-A2-R1_Chr3-2g06113 [Microbotryum saponariae]
MSRHRPPIAAPLLSFPPNPPNPSTAHAAHHDRCSLLPTVAGATFTSSSTASTTATAAAASGFRPLPRKQRHLIVRICLMTPLFFITSLYLFAAYAYLFSLDYLWVERHSYLKASVYAIVFLWFELNGLIAVWHCWYRGGGHILASRPGDDDDEEQLLGTPHRSAPIPVRPSPKEEQGLLQNDAGLTVNQPSSAVDSAARSGSTVKTTAMRELSDMARAGDSGTHTSARHEQAASTIGVQVKSDGKQRWCRKVGPPVSRSVEGFMWGWAVGGADQSGSRFQCRLPKPDRAHHCSSCRACVLKMDHHCPWLGGGCVGWANHKFFLLFLLYSGALGIWVSATTMKELVDFVADDDQDFELAPVIWAIAFFVGIVFGISVGLFGVYHLYLASRNRTTIESMENSTSVIASDSRPAHYRSENHAMSREDRKRLDEAQGRLNIYDLGWKRNLRQVMGESWKEWFVPFGWPAGDGHSFPVDQEQLDQLRNITLLIRSGQHHAHAQMHSSAEFADEDEDGNETEVDSRVSSETGREIRRA